MRNLPDAARPARSGRWRGHAGPRGERDPAPPFREGTVVTDSSDRAPAPADRSLPAAVPHRPCREVARTRHLARRTARAWGPGGSDRGGGPHGTPPRWHRPPRTG
ncbi:hypothetical protein Shyhy01_47790 [Streptomyces hygroscopicus subsp. hygroscopicus]|nr:hypothetical protein Shyhy01_47790 [Streptomyces hygroscopicus subsp. hygroscopicus]